MLCIETANFLLIVALLSLKSFGANELLMRKCCPQWQEISPHSSECVDRVGNHGNESWPAKTNRSVAEVRDAENGAHFPWWMSNETKPLDPTTRNPVTGFLGEQDGLKYIEYGVMYPCEKHMMKAISQTSRKLQLLHNGTIIFQNITFSPSSYCADMMDGGHGFFLCPCLEGPCIKKCCKRGNYITLTRDRRVWKSDCNSTLDNGMKWTPRIYYDNLTEIEPPLPPSVLLYKDLICPEDRHPVAVKPENSGFWRFPNGSVLAEAFSDIPFEPQLTCGDLSVIDENKTFVENLFVCASLKKKEALTANTIFYVSLYIIGTIFMLLALGVFALVPETRKVNFSYIVCHIVSQFPAYIILTVSNIMSVVPPALCYVIPFVIQFSFLASFFWLNVMCIDISSAFSGFRPPQGSVAKRDRKKFLYYSLFAWGSPVIITIVTAIMEFVEDIPNTYLKPDFAVQACWFKEKSAAFAYFYGPMTTILLVNFILFIYTTIKIIKVQRDTRILHKGESSRHDGSNFKRDKKRLILYAKLFCLMGLTWVTEIISWLHGSPQYYWYVTDAINLLRAVFIFIIFCCKRKVFRLLKQRLFPSLVSQDTSTSQSNGTRKSNSTQSSDLPPVAMTQLASS